MSTAEHSRPDSSGALSSPPQTRLPFDPFEVDEMSDAELDAIVHGVIALDAKGRILRYNLAEANLARLDRHAVLGRDFFEEVAPCTRTPEFEGQFRRLVESGEQRVPRFAYLFDFKFGAQVCDVEMVRATKAQRFYIFVTRKSFAEARSGLADGWAAPLQEELVNQPESAQGVLRDRAQQRQLRVDADFIATLLQTARAEHALDWPRFCHRWGERWGRRLVVGLEMWSAQENEASLEELPFQRTMTLVQQLLARSGWGLAEVRTTYAAEGVIVVELHRSLLAEIAETGRAGSEVRGSGALLEGVLGALFSHLGSRKLAAVELPGALVGGNQFVIVNEALHPLVSSLLSSGAARSVEQLLPLVRTARATQSIA